MNNRRRDNRRRVRLGVGAVSGLRGLGARLHAKLRVAARLLLRALPYALVAAVIALTPVVVVYGYRYVTEAQEFGVRDVSVSGHDHVSIAEIREIAGVKDAPNLISLDLERVRARVEEHPWVSSARVERHLPDKLTIEVVERKPTALVALGALYLVDAKGVVFARVEPGEHFDLPVLTGLNHEDLSPTGPPERLALSQRLLKGALRLLRTWRAGQGSQVSEIHMDPLFGYSVVLGQGAGIGEGAVVRLGHGEISAKLERLNAILVDAGRRGRRVAEVRLNDERDPTRVAVRFRDAAVGNESGDGEGTGDAEEHGGHSERG